MTNENSLRQQVIDVAVVMSESGLSPGRSGNVSARYENGFLITPSAMLYTDMMPDDIVFVDENKQKLAKSRHPSSEWRFHYDIYKQYSETGGIVHCHSRHASALACCNKEIPPFHYMVAVAGGKKIPIAPYALFGTQELSDHVVAALDGYKATLMQHHGLTALGEDSWSALDLAQEIEDLAAQYVVVLNLGSEQLLSDEQMEKVLQSFKTYGKQATP